ncbi:MAG: tetratricopeptide repeat protein [Bacteroidota bacterium]
MRFILINLFILIFFQDKALCQTQIIDSLEKELTKTSDNKLKIVIYNKLGTEYLYDNIDKLPKCVNEISSLSEKLNNPEGKALADNLMANYQYFKGNYSIALEYFQKNITFYIDTKNNNSLGNTYLSLGNVYESMGESDKAIFYYLKSLKIDEEIGDKQRLSDDYTNLGVFYNHRNNPKKALFYFQKALELDIELKNDQFIVGTYVNLGSVYFALKDIPKSLEYLLKGYKKAKETNNLDGLARLSNNLGQIFFEEKDYEKALKYNLESVAIKEELGQKEGLTNSYLSLGTLYENMGKDNLALYYFQKSYDLSKSIKHVEGIVDVSKVLSNYYEKRNNPTLSLRYHKEYSSLKDTLFNMKSEEKITEMSTKYESEKKENQILLLEKDKKVNQIEAKKQKIVIYATIGGLVLVLLFLMLLFKRFKITQKQKAIIEKQKHETELQKELVEEKNKEIVDSITYAKRLQDAILPPLKLVQKYLEHSFILYKPKDIVAGDFYWFENKGDLLLFAAADCTGHGVPGAMVSVVCSNALNRTVKEFGITEPGKILDKVRELVVETFEKSESEVKDGMDISLCALNTKTNELFWSGANNPLWLIRASNSEQSDESKTLDTSSNISNLNTHILIEYKADKQPIGKTENSKLFSTQKIDLQKNDTFYIFTDGYCDQFGGDGGKKFKSANFKKFLLTIQDSEMSTQSKLINDVFEEWRGHLEQVDDVCVIGVRV